MIYRTTVCDRMLRHKGAVMDNAKETKKRIFIVEDEKRIARFLQMELEHEGFSTSMEDNGRRAFEKIVQGEYDLVLLDVMLPDMDGMEICRRVRELSDVPIIMLTARDDIEDKVHGLDIGADDYITKPFSIAELLARIRAVSEAEDDSDKLTVRELSLFPARHAAQLSGQYIDLTKKEYALLEYLVRNKRAVLSRDQILQEVWGYDYMGDTNVVDVYISYLRSKIDEPSGEKYIHTVRGVGYVIKE